jgi:ribose-phosphate pyrophosphokinase
MSRQIIVLKDNKSDFFDLISYPDGQHSIKLKLELLNKKHPVNIRCRIKYFSELEVLSCLISALKKNDFYIGRLEFAYLFGIRSDRAFELGQPNYLRDVLLPIILSFKIPYVNIEWAFYLDLEPPIHSRSCQSITNENSKLIFSPDIYIFAADETAANGFKSDCFFIKQRDSNGEFSIKIGEEFNRSDLYNKEIMIVDDLCDGGRTFIEEAKILRKEFPSKKMSLFVYHGLFTNGIEILTKHFDHIICTNSYQDIDHPQVTQIKVI